MKDNLFPGVRITSLAKTLSAATLAVLLITQSTFPQPASGRPFLDFSGDQRTDFAVVRPSGGALTWSVLRNQSTQPDVITTFTFGGTSDQITPANYFGSSKTEPAYYRNAQATFFATPFSDGMTSVLYPSLTGWGQPNDLGKYPGDYDGDGKDDHTVLRLQSGLLYWYIRGSTGVNRTMLFGTNNSDTYEFAFRGADYNGDGRDEIVLCYVNIASGQAVWYFGDPINQTLVGVGSLGNYYYDYLINPADYTGDRRADLAIVAGGKSPGPGAGNWYVYNTANGDQQFQLLFSWAHPGDIPLSGDYDGDGVYDVAFYHPANATFHWAKSSTRESPPRWSHAFGNEQASRQFGNVGDTPVAGLWSY